MKKKRIKEFLAVPAVVYEAVAKNNQYSFAGLYMHYSVAFSSTPIGFSTMRMAAAHFATIHIFVFVKAPLRGNPRARRLGDRFVARNRSLNRGVLSLS